MPLTELLGRDADLLTLRQWLADPHVRLITLIGPGGVGKTRLALELARSMADEGTPRVVFASLDAIQDPGLAACAIAEALGLADISASDLPRRARAACEGYPTLLVLDSLEQVQHAAPLVTDLLTSATTLRLLATSRVTLRVRGEREYALGPLALEAGSEELSPAELARVPAVRLFVERVRSVQSDFRLTSANGRTVTAICRRLDALPLALELAAPWLKVLTAEDLLRRLEQDVLLSGGRSARPPRTSTDDERDGRLELSPPQPGRAAGLSPLGALPARFLGGGGRGGLAGQDGVAAHDEVLGALAGLIDKSLLLPGRDRR